MDVLTALSIVGVCVGSIGIGIVYFMTRRHKFAARYLVAALICTFVYIASASRILTTELTAEPWLTIAVVGMAAYVFITINVMIDGVLLLQKRGQGR